MKFNIFNSLRVKIAVLITALTAGAFLLSSVVAVYTVKTEKINDLKKVLSHTLEETRDEYLPLDANETLDLAYLYGIPHNVSIMSDSDAESIKFKILKTPYISAADETAEYVRLANGYYLNCVSSNAKIDNSVIKYAEKLILKYSVFLLFVLLLSLIVLQKLMKPLGDIADKCREYKDGGGFLTDDRKYPSEISVVYRALYGLVVKLEDYRKREKELFKEAAHELKTPLAIMRARLDVYQNDASYQKEKFSQELTVDIERLTTELRNVLFFEISDFEESDRYEICTLVSEVMSKMDTLAKSRRIFIEFQCESFYMQTKKRLFQKLISALLENAMTYAKEGGNVKITLSAVDRKLCIMNEKGTEKYMFSSKIGERILKRVSLELGLAYTLSDTEDAYEVCLSI